jgi:opacity protein-like surface antigen
MRTLTATAVALALALPAAAAAQQTQTQQNQGQQMQGQQMQGQRGVARECLQELDRFNEQLVGDNYGIVGPRGYGIDGYGVADYGVAAPGYRGMATTPLGQMRMAMRTAQMFAASGMQDACMNVLAGMRQLHDRYQQAIADMDMEDAELTAWRTDWLANAVPVESVEGTLSAAGMIGADVRNMADEDLGDIETTVVDPDTGEIRYALVSTGGFLDIGDDLVPVPWERLKVTPLPFRDTFVLEMPEEVFENAPSLDDDAADMTVDQIGERVEQFWSQQAEQQGDRG